MPAADLNLTARWVSDRCVSERDEEGRGGGSRFLSTSARDRARRIVGREKPGLTAQGNRSMPAREARHTPQLRSLL